MIDKIILSFEGINAQTAKLINKLAELDSNTIAAVMGLLLFASNFIAVRTAHITNLSLLTMMIWGFLAAVIYYVGSKIGGQWAALKISLIAGSLQSFYAFSPMPILLMGLGGAILEAMLSMLERENAISMYIPSLFMGSYSVKCLLGPPLRPLLIRIMELVVMALLVLGMARIGTAFGQNITKE